MDIQAALEWCDQVMAKVDGERMAWSQCLDRISFAIGMGKKLPLVYYANGERIEIGTAEIRHDDNLLYAAMHITSIDKDFVSHPIMTAPRGSYSIGYSAGPPEEVHVKPLPAEQAPPASSYSFGFGETGEPDYRVLDTKSGEVKTMTVDEFRSRFYRALRLNRYVGDDVSIEPKSYVLPRRYSNLDVPFTNYTMKEDGSVVNNLTGQTVFTKRKKED